MTNWTKKKINNNICIWENSVIFFFASNEGVFDSVILWFAFEKICLKTLMRLVFVWVKESVCVWPRSKIRCSRLRKTHSHQCTRDREIAPLYLPDLFCLRTSCSVHCHWQTKKKSLVLSQFYNLLKIVYPTPTYNLFKAFVYLTSS